WTSGPASAELPAGNHVFTATATQASSISGNPEGTSAPVSFTVNTNPPTVTLAALSSPSNNPAPSFAGTASETSAVTVTIYSLPRRTVKATAIAAGTGGSWSSAAASPTLTDGKYAAIATQPS